uniref:Uncharacterized protein n=1 Tax=Vibrio parahaemolyticus TaxID=670 RepID=A0A0C5GS93_VIBPH|nr:hypothetical protein pVPH1_0120 [Vibrio parahaemolyticus]
MCDSWSPKTNSITNNPTGDSSPAGGYLQKLMEI